MAKEKKEKEIRELKDLPGVGPATLEKLKNAGIDSIYELAVCSPATLELAGISSDTAEKLISIAQEVLQDEQLIMTAKEFEEKRKQLKRITTSSKALDSLFGGGIETGAITEFFGPFASGKTQICHQLCVNVQRPEEEGGLEKGAIYVDTEGTFRPERIRAMAEALGMDAEKVLENIIYYRCPSSYHQMMFIKKEIKGILKSRDIGLLIVDSLTSHFRSEYVGRGMLSERQQKLNEHIHDLLRIAEVYNLAVVFTNQVMEDPGIMFGDPIKPIGGMVLAHASTYRVKLRKAKDDKRIAKMIDSPCSAEREVVFRITSEGIRDE
jgi:DNA repair protein RadA